MKTIGEKSNNIGGHGMAAKLSVALTGMALALSSCASGTAERYSCTGKDGYIKIQIVETGTYPNRTISTELVEDKGSFCADGELSHEEKEYFQ